jgi:hypothetical protein
VSSRGSATSGARERLGAGSRRSREGKGVVIDLSSAQVDAVVRAAAGGGSAVVLLAGLGDVRGALAEGLALLDDPRLSRSLLSGLLMLASFPADGSYVGNAQIARMLGMNPSTSHRYLSTLVAVGLLERDPDSRRCRRAVA